MKFISTSDFVFSGREGRSVFKDLGIPKGGDEYSGIDEIVEKAKEEKEKTKARFAIREEWKKLDDVIKGGKIDEEVKMLSTIAQNEKIIDTDAKREESSWELMKNIFEKTTGVETMTSEERLKIIINNVSESALETFVLTNPSLAKELFTDKLKNTEESKNKYKIKFYGNKYLNDQMGLENILPYSDKFIEKNGQVAIRTANGYMRLDKNGEKTTERLVIYDGDEISILDEKLIAETYPKLKISSNEKDYLEEINRRGNYSYLQLVKSIANELIDSGDISEKEKQELVQLKRNLDDIDKGLSSGYYATSVMGSCMNVLENNSELLLKWKHVFEKKLQKEEELKKSVDETAKNQQELETASAKGNIGNQDLRIKQDLLSVKTMILKNHSVFIKFLETNKNGTEEEKQTVQKELFKSQEAISRKETEVKKSFMDRFDKIGNLQSLEKKINKKEIKNLIENLDKVFKNNPEKFSKDEDPREFLRLISDRIDFLPKTWAQEQIGNYSVSAYIRINKIIKKLNPGNEVRKELEKFLMKKKEEITGSNKEIIKNKKDKLEIYRKDIEMELGETKFTQYLNLLKSNKKDELESFISKLDSEVKNACLNYAELLEEIPMLEFKQIMFQKIRFVMQNEKEINEINEVLRILENNEDFSSLMQKSGISHLRIYTIVNNGDFSDFKKIVDEYPGNNSAILKLKKLIGEEGFMTFTENLEKVNEASEDVGVFFENLDDNLKEIRKKTKEKMFKDFNENLNYFEGASWTSAETKQLIKELKLKLEGVDSVNPPSLFLRLGEKLNEDLNSANLLSEEKKEVLIKLKKLNYFGSEKAIKEREESNKEKREKIVKEFGLALNVKSEEERAELTARFRSLDLNDEESVKKLKEDSGLTEETFKDFIKRLTEVETEKTEIKRMKQMSEKFKFLKNNNDIVKRLRSLITKLPSDFISRYEDLIGEKLNSDSYDQIDLIIINELIDDYLKDHPNEKSVKDLQDYLNELEVGDFLNKLSVINKKLTKTGNKLKEQKEILEIMQKTETLDDFYKEMKKRKKAEEVYLKSFPNGDLNSTKAKIAIANTVYVESIMPNFKIDHFTTEGLPVYKVGELQQEIVVDVDRDEMYSNNANEKETMSDYQKCPVSPRFVPVVQVFGAILDASFWTTDYGASGSRRKLGKEKLQNMIVQIYPLGEFRELTENEINGWRNMALELRARGKSIDYFWKVMGATYDEDGGIIDESGKEIGPKVKAAIEASRNNNFDWLKMIRSGLVK